MEEFIMCILGILALFLGGGWAVSKAKMNADIKEVQKEKEEVEKACENAIAEINRKQELKNENQRETDKKKDSLDTGNPHRDYVNGLNLMRKSAKDSKTSN